jgi:hypothetical protein
MSKFKKVLDDPPILYHKEGSVWREDNGKWYWSLFDGKINGPGTQQEAMEAVPKGLVKPCKNPEDEIDTKLICPKCGKQCSSTSGLTLHKKTCKGKKK